MSDDSKPDFSFDNDPGAINDDGNNLDFTFSDIPILGDDKALGVDLSNREPEKDPALASFEALISEQPKNDDEFDIPPTEPLSEEDKIAQSQMEIERVKAIRKAKRRKKRIILLSIIISGAALLAGIVVLLFAMFKSPSGENGAKKLTPKELAAMKAAKFKEKLDAMMATADKLYDEGKFSEALSQYRKVLENDDSRSAAHFGVGKCLEAENKFAEAIKEYEIAVSMKPESPAPFNKLAHLLISEKKRDRAKKILEKGLSKFTDDQTMLATLANLCYETNDSEKALECYKRLNTGNMELGEIKKYASLLQYESKDAAKKLFVTAARKFKDLSLYISASALAQDDDERLKILLDAEKEMGGDNENLNSILCHITKIYVKLDKKDDAKNCLKKIQMDKLTPDLYPVIFKLAIEAGVPLGEAFTIPEDGLPEEAKQNKTLMLLSYMLKSAPNNVDAQILLLKSLEETLSTEKILDVYGDFWAMNNKSPTVCYLRAKVLEDAYNLQEAEKVYKDLIAMCPDFYNAYISLGKIYFIASRYGEAKEMFQKCVKLKPKANLPRQMLAKTEIMMGEGNKALKKYSAFLNAGKTPKTRKALLLADVAMRMSTPTALDGYLAELKSDPAMKLKYKNLIAKRNMMFGGAKLSDFAAARKGIFRQYKMIYLLSCGKLMRVLSVYTPKEEFPDFWKVYVMLKKNIIKRKKYQPPKADSSSSKASTSETDNKKVDILEELYKKTRRSNNIPEKMAAALWNGKRTLAESEQLAPLIPANQLALYYFLLAEEYRHVRQRTKARVRFRKALSAPRSVYRQLIEHEYKHR